MTKKQENVPLSTSFVKRIHWWYGMAWALLILWVVSRWGSTGY
jgi:hypothetical protein